MRYHPLTQRYVSILYLYTPFIVPVHREDTLFSLVSGTIYGVYRNKLTAKKSIWSLYIYIPYIVPDTKEIVSEAHERPHIKLWIL